MSSPTYIIKTRELFSKLSDNTRNQDLLFSEPDIGSGMIQSRLNGLSYENGEVSAFLSYCKLEDGKVYNRFLFQIKVQSSGKVKNIDSVMALITQFEDEYIYADKISVFPESGSIYVDIYKLKKGITNG